MLRFLAPQFVRLYSQVIPNHHFFPNATMQPAPKGKLHDARLPHSLHTAYRCLLLGQVIALPTDTVYGLACDANNEHAIQQLYTIKGRDSHKPVAICVKDLAAVRRYGNAEHLNDALLERLLPGPLTIVIERSPQLNNRFLNPTTTKIGIRIPDSAFMKHLCTLFNQQPLALTSANRSAERSSLCVQEFESLWPRLGGIFDAGPIGLNDDRRAASTVLDLAIPGQYKVVREGVALKQTLDVLNDFGFKSIECNED